MWLVAPSAAIAFTGEDVVGAEVAKEAAVDGGKEALKSGHHLRASAAATASRAAEAAEVRTHAATEVDGGELRRWLGRRRRHPCGCRQR